MICVPRLHAPTLHTLHASSRHIPLADLRLYVLVLLLSLLLLGTGEFVPLGSCVRVGRGPAGIRTLPQGCGTNIPLTQPTKLAYTRSPFVAVAVCRSRVHNRIA